jgi:ribose/xylose/arabinose/galactoside ABC-type transport system permease subunit
VLLVVVLVYTAALTRYGSPELVMRVADAEDWTRDHLGGVPHPVEVLVGIPALAWGVSMRSRRRQGWWVIAFGTAATAAAASKLAEQDLTTRGTSLSAVYSIVLGLVLGCIVIRLERLLSGRDGRRTARRTAQEAAAAAARHEPGRLQPLH